MKRTFSADRRRASWTSSSRRAPPPMIRTARLSRSRRNVQARISVSRSWAWPTLPECMTTKRFVSRCSRAHGLSRGAAGAPGLHRPSSGSPGSAPPARPSPRAGASSCRRSRPRGRPSGATSRRAGATTGSTNGLRSRPSLTAISGKTSWAITSSGTRKRAATTRAIAPMNGGSVMQTTRSGRLRTCPSTSRRARTSGSSSPGARAASARMRSTGRGGSGRRSAPAGPEPRRRAGDHGDVVVGGERLAELGEQVGGRLDTGPVVLVEDEKALPGHGKQAIRDPPAERAASVHGRRQTSRSWARTRRSAAAGRAARSVSRPRPRPSAGRRRFTYVRMPSRCRPVDAAQPGAAGRQIAPPCATRGASGWSRRRRRTGTGGPAQRPPLLGLDRHRARGGVGRQAPRASRLPPRGDPGQRAGAPAAGARGAGRRPARLRDLAGEPRQRRPRRRSRRVEVGILPLPVDLERFAPAPDEEWRATPRRPRGRLRRPRGRPAQERRAAARRAASASARGLLLVGEPPAGPLPDRVRGDGVVPDGRPVPAPRDAARLPLPPGGLRDRGRRGDGGRAAGGDHSVGWAGGARPGLGRRCRALAGSRRRSSPDRVRALLADPQRLADMRSTGARVRRA